MSVGNVVDPKLVDDACAEIAMEIMLGYPRTYPRYTGERRFNGGDGGRREPIGIWGGDDDSNVAGEVVLSLGVARGRWA